jgi:hypothetical protein
MMYVTQATLAKRSLRGRQLRNELLGAFDERRLRDHLVESSAVPGAETSRIGVIRVTEDRYVGVRLGDLQGVDTGNVDDHEVGWIGVIDRDETMPMQKRLELPPKIEIDPAQQDRRHRRIG